MLDTQSTLAYWSRVHAVCGVVVGGGGEGRREGWMEGDRKSVV